MTEISAVWAYTPKKEIFVDAPEAVKCVMSVPNYGLEVIEKLLTCPYWALETAGREPSFRHGIDAMAIEGFFDGCLQYDAYLDQIRTWFTDDDGGVTRGLEQLQDGRHLDGCGTDVVSLGTRYSTLQNLAASYGLSLVAYEGGQRVTGGGHSIQEDPDFTDFYLSLNRNGAMADRYRENFAQWRKSGGHLFMHLSDIERPSKFRTFGSLEYLTQETSPKWEALMEFKNTTCWWDGC